MPDLKQQTIDTYNKSAKELAKYFRGIGSRTDDINRAFNLAGDPKKPRVLEIGCGDGRDAQEIIKRADWYLGFDVSIELIKLAKKLVPSADFRVADANSFEYPKNLDVVFAFASLLHLNKGELKTILDTVYYHLNNGGVFYISLKFSPQYEEQTKVDKFGTRQFFFYDPDTIKDMAKGKYVTVFLGHEKHGGTDWFDIALKKL